MADEKEIKQEEQAAEAQKAEDAEASTAEQNEEAKAEEAGEEKKEKKENAFSKFWKKTKQSVNDAVLESKIRSAFEKAHASFSVYTKDELFAQTVYGSVEGDVLTVFGKVEVKPGAVVIADDKDETAYYAVRTAETTVKSMVEGTEYEREGTSITLDAKVEEVNVVKAGKRYFIYKGEETK